jgi:hypothetical protein
MKEAKTCGDLLMCFMTKLCIPSKADHGCMKEAFHRIDKHCLKAFYLLEKKHYISVCGHTRRIKPSKWSIDTHRLVILSLIFGIVLKRGNEGIEQVAKWLLYIAIVVVAGIAIMRVVGKFG